MRLIADIDGMHAGVGVLLDYSGILAPFALTMIIDTGATNACLLPDHVHYFRIPYRRLSNARDPSTTVSGRIVPKLLPNVDLFIPVKTGPLHTRDELWQVHFDEFHILPPSRRRLPEPRHRVVSLLGMDVLQYFKNWKWNWGLRKLILET